MLSVLEIGKAEVDFVTIFVFSWDKSELLKSGKGSENMGNLTLASVGWEALDIDSFGSI